MKEVISLADKFFSEALNLSDYLDRHKSEIKIAGPALEVADPATLKEINDKVQILQTETQAIQKAANKLRSLVYGTNNITGSKN